MGFLGFLSLLMHAASTKGEPLSYTWTNPTSPPAGSNEQVLRLYRRVLQATLFLHFLHLADRVSSCNRLHHLLSVHLGGF